MYLDQILMINAHQSLAVISVFVCSADPAFLDHPLAVTSGDSCSTYMVDI